MRLVERQIRLLLARRAESRARNDTGSDKEKAKRATQAITKMRKIDIATIEKAARNEYLSNDLEGDRKY